MPGDRLNDMTLNSDSRLGPYKIVEPIGAGGMGEVYRALDTKLGREVAIKVLPEAFAQDKERLARFEREARLLASLNHPNIATLFDLQEHDGTHFLVLELVPGETLAEQIKRGPVPIDEVLPLFRQIAEALEAAHENGVIHRDLKPANIKITPEGKVKVLDFGLAKALVGEASPVESSQSPTLTKGTALGAIMGTAGYMSPEQARGKTVDKRTDIWAFGCCLYEALTGRKAFGGETVTDVLAAVVKTEPGWKTLPDTTPWKIRELLERCLRKDTSRRLHDIADARIDIDDALGEPSIEIPPPARVDRRGTAVRVALIAMVAATLGAIVAWLSMRAPPPREQPITRLTVSLPEGQTLAGRAHPFAISSDGMRLVYVAETGATQQLYLRDLDDFEARPLPGTEGGSNPFFSPDGGWIGFYADGNIKKISATGGATITLCKASPFIGRDRGCGSVWQDDDTIIFSDSESVLMISADGGTPKSLTTRSKVSDVSHFWPQMLPDGKNLLFTEFDYGGESLLSLFSMETGQSRVLLRGNIASFQARYMVTGHLVYAQSGGLWAVPFDVSRLELTGSPVSILDGVHEVSMTSNEPATFFAVADMGTLVYAPGGVVDKTSLVWVDRDGREILLVDGKRLRHPRLSPDGTRVAMAVSSPEGSDIWVYDVDRGTRTRLTFGGLNYEPVWSQDGARIAFPGPTDVRWVPADGSATAQILVPEANHAIVPSSWSPDGRTLAFYEVNPNTARDIYVMQTDGESTPTPILVTEFNEHSPMFSPDGRWLAYVSDESGREEVYIRAFSGPGAKHVVSTDGGREPTWSADGRELFYRNGDKMMAVAVQIGQDFTSGIPKVLFEGRYAMGSGGGNEYDVTPDGRRFLMVRSDLESAPRQINVVLNWAEELKRLVPTK